MTGSLNLCPTCLKIVIWARLQYDHTLQISAKPANSRGSLAGLFPIFFCSKIRKECTLLI